MTWSTEADFKQQLERRWLRGELLRALVGAENLFPLRLQLRTPEPREIAQKFGAVQDWIAGLQTMKVLRLDWRSVSSRALGNQSLPEAVWVSNAEDAIALIEKQQDAERFYMLYEKTKASLPELLPWLLKNPLRGIELNSSWANILRVVVWMKSRPRPNIYTRQIDLLDVDTKFIETHTALLSELFDQALNPSSINEDYSGLGQFHLRYGFLCKPNRIRFRVLDPSIRFASLEGTPDVELDAQSFAVLRLSLDRVFVTENEINFLAFPKMVGSIVVFGSGYGMKALGLARWMASLPLHYWGDIDTHGFAILDELRIVFPHTQSFLMDRETLLRHREFWGVEAIQVRRDLLRLSQEESRLFSDLRACTFGEGVRLEQERVSFSRIMDAMQSVVEGESPSIKTESSSSD